MSDYLGREGAPFSEDLWNQIDRAVVDSAKETLVARRFLPLHGPLGPGVATVAVDRLGREEVESDGFSVMQGRALVQLPLLWEDFWLYWRDLESAQPGIDMSLSAARTAAQALAIKEDRMVFYGVEALGIEGLLTAKGINTLKRSGDWGEGENAYRDVAQAMSTLVAKGRIGRHTLVVSPDVQVQLARIQPGTGILESARLEAMLGRKIQMSTSLKPGTALLVSAQPQYVDLVVGQDIRTAYTEAVDLNHHLRVLETALPRVKAADAIVVFE